MQKFIIYSFVVCSLLFSGCKVVPPTITRFEAPSNILRGDKAVLLWDVTPSKYLKNIALKNLADSLPIQGKAEVKPTKLQSYELRITFKHKRKTLSEARTVHIQVTEPPVKFTGTKHLNIGEEARLEWQLPHFAKNVRISEWIDGDMTTDWNDIPSQASINIAPVQNARYKLEYLDEGALKVLTHEVSVTPAFFTGTRKIIAGEEVQLIWKTNPKAPHVSLEKRENSYTREVIKEQLPQAGNFKLMPKQSTEYLLSIIDVHHTTLLHRVEVVQGVINGQKIVKQGEKGYISWRANPEAKKIWIEKVENNQPTMLYANLHEEGQLEVKPTNTSTYLLAVETQEGITKYAHTMRVTAPNEAGIYTQSNTQTSGYDIEVIDPRHIKSASSQTDAPITIEPHIISETATKVYFEFSKTQVAESDKPVLDALVAKLKKDEVSIAEISGHSDLKGSAKGCEAVAKERAEILKKYLVDAGIPEYRIITKSYGRMYPLNYQEMTEANARENRRAEIVILK